MPGFEESASVRRLNGPEETEEAGGYRQRHAGQDEAEEEDLAGGGELVEAAETRDPLHRLARDAPDRVEVAVVMEQDDVVHSGNCCD
jgi:hypothetical protein